LDLTQTITNAVVVATVGAILGWMVHGLRAELSGLRGEIKGDIGELRAEMRDEIRELRREVADLRSDLTQVALAVGVKRRASSE
jgi:hypothetical protein